MRTVTVCIDAQWRSISSRIATSSSLCHPSTRRDGSAVTHSFATYVCAHVCSISSIGRDRCAPRPLFGLRRRRRCLGRLLATGHALRLEYRTTLVLVILALAVYVAGFPLAVVLFLWRRSNLVRSSLPSQPFTRLCAFTLTLLFPRSSPSFAATRISLCYIFL